MERKEKKENIFFLEGLLVDKVVPGNMLSVWKKKIKNVKGQRLEVRAILTKSELSCMLNFHFTLDYCAVITRMLFLFFFFVYFKSE